MKVRFTDNNFNLVRLIAAIQVAYHHSFSHLKIEYDDWGITQLSLFFPGVPIFFFISGFLISKSYINNPNISEYATHRVLRIYPALIACTFLSVLIVYISGYFSNINIDPVQLIAWIGSQISFLQFYNPDFMRGFGTGVLNGSLWVITVVLQFYVLIPFLYRIMGSAERRKINIILITLISLSIIINETEQWLKVGNDSDVLFKLWKVSFVPWVYIFLTGVLFQNNFEYVHRLLHKRFMLCFFAYMMIAYTTNKYFGWSLANNINPLLYLLLASVVFSFAYSFSTVGNGIFRNDLSYGIYIYHMPIVNVFIFFGYAYNASYAVIVLVLTIFTAFVSWLYFEKPFMKLKRHSLNPI